MYFCATLSPQESITFLEALNLSRDHLLDKLPLQIASTGLPYLLVPVNRGLDSARIVKQEFEKQLARFGAKFVYVFDVNRKEGRTWDNDAESKTSQLVVLQGRRILSCCAWTGEFRADNRNFARPSAMPGQSRRDPARQLESQARPEL